MEQSKSTWKLGGVAVRMVIVLTAVCVVCGAALVYIYDYAAPKMKINAENEMKRAIESLFPEAGKIDVVKKDEIFSIRDKSGAVAGYAIVAFASGYQGVIKMLVGTDKDISSLVGFEVLESQETPGLGDEVKSEKFSEQFKKLSLAGEIECLKGRRPEKPGQVEAVTGATISSRAVVGGINEAVERAREFLRDKK